MGRAVVRRRAALTGLAATTVFGLAGCSNQPGWTYADDEDVQRAAAMWRDPWFAPTEPAIPESAYGQKPPSVGRHAGDRYTDYTGMTVTEVAREEVRVALDHGWQLVAAACRRPVRLVLTKGTGLDGAAASVEVSGGSGVVTAAVEVAVAHHSDTAWLELRRPLSLADSCLAGGQRTPVPDVPSGGAPLPDADSAETSDVEDPEWQREELSTDEQALVDAVNANPWLVAQEATVSPPSNLQTGDIRRYGPTAGDDVRTEARDPRRALAEVVAEMTGWELTWMACGAGRTPEATAVLRTEAGSVSARLTATPHHVLWIARLPVPEGPTPTWLDDVPALDRSRCLGRRPPAALTVEGVPAVMPHGIQPLTD